MFLVLLISYAMLQGGTGVQQASPVYLQGTQSVNENLYQLQDANFKLQ